MSSAVKVIVVPGTESGPVFYEISHERDGRLRTVKQRFSTLDAMRHGLWKKRLPLPDVPFPRKQAPLLMFVHKWHTGTPAMPAEEMEERREGLQAYLSELSGLKDSWRSDVVTEVLCLAEDNATSASASPAGDQANEAQPPSSSALPPPVGKAVSWVDQQTPATALTDFAARPDEAPHCIPRSPPLPPPPVSALSSSSKLTPPSLSLSSPKPTAEAAAVAAGAPTSSTTATGGGAVSASASVDAAAGSVLLEETRDADVGEGNAAAAVAAAAAMGAPAAAAAAAPEDSTPTAADSCEEKGQEPTAFLSPPKGPADAAADAAAVADGPAASLERTEPRLLTRRVRERARKRLEQQSHAATAAKPGSGGGDAPADTAAVNPIPVADSAAISTPPVSLPSSPIRPAPFTAEPGEAGRVSQSHDVVWVSSSPAAAEQAEKTSGVPPAAAIPGDAPATAGAVASPAGKATAAEGERNTGGGEKEEDGGAEGAATVQQPGIPSTAEEEETQEAPGSSGGGEKEGREAAAEGGLPESTGTPGAEVQAGESLLPLLSLSAPTAVVTAAAVLAAEIAAEKPEDEESLGQQTEPPLSGKTLPVTALPATETAGSQEGQTEESLAVAASPVEDQTLAEDEGEASGSAGSSAVVAAATGGDLAEITAQKPEDEESLGQQTEPLLSEQTSPATALPGTETAGSQDGQTEESVAVASSPVEDQTLAEDEGEASGSAGASAVVAAATGGDTAETTAQKPEDEERLGQQTEPPLSDQTSPATALPGTETAGSQEGRTEESVAVAAAPVEDQTLAEDEGEASGSEGASTVVVTATGDDTAETTAEEPEDEERLGQQTEPPSSDQTSPVTALPGTETAGSQEGRTEESVAVAASPVEDQTLAEDEGEASGSEGARAVVAAATGGDLAETTAEEPEEGERLGQQTEPPSSEQTLPATALPATDTVGSQEGQTEESVAVASSPVEHQTLAEDEGEAPGSAGASAVVAAATGGDTAETTAEKPEDEERLGQQTEPPLSDQTSPVTALPGTETAGSQDGQTEESVAVAAAPVEDQTLTEDEGEASGIEKASAVIAAATGGDTAEIAAEEPEEGERLGQQTEPPLSDQTSPATALPGTETAGSQGGQTEESVAVAAAPVEDQTLAEDEGEASGIEKASPVIAAATGGDTAEIAAEEPEEGERLGQQTEPPLSDQTSPATALPGTETAGSQEGRTEESLAVAASPVEDQTLAEDEGEASGSEGARAVVAAATGGDLAETTAKKPEDEERLGQQTEPPLSEQTSPATALPATETVGSQEGRTEESVAVAAAPVEAQTLTEDEGEASGIEEASAVIAAATGGDTAETTAEKPEEGERLGQQTEPPLSEQTSPATALPGTETAGSQEGQTEESVAVAAAPVEDQTLAEDEGEASGSEGASTVVVKATGDDTAEIAAQKPEEGERLGQQTEPPLSDQTSPATALPGTETAGSQEGQTEESVAVAAAPVEDQTLAEDEGEASGSEGASAVVAAATGGGTSPAEDYTVALSAIDAQDPSDSGSEEASAEVSTATGSAAPVDGRTPAPPAGEVAAEIQEGPSAERAAAEDSGADAQTMSILAVAAAAADAAVEQEGREERDRGHASAVSALSLSSATEDYTKEATPMPGLAPAAYYATAAAAAAAAATATSAEAVPAKGESREANVFCADGAAAAPGELAGQTVDAHPPTSLPTPTTATKGRASLLNRARRSLSSKKTTADAKQKDAAAAAAAGGVNPAEDLAQEEAAAAPSKPLSLSSTATPTAAGPSAFTPRTASRLASLRNKARGWRQSRGSGGGGGRDSEGSGPLSGGRAGGSSSGSGSGPLSGRRSLGAVARRKTVSGPLSLSSARSGKGGSKGFFSIMSKSPEAAAGDSDGHKGEEGLPDPGEEESGGGGGVSPGGLAPASGSVTGNPAQIDSDDGALAPVGAKDAPAAASGGGGFDSFAVPPSPSEG